MSVTLGLLAALVFAALVGPLLLVLSPWLAQVWDDLHRDDSWAAHLARFGKDAGDRGRR